MIPGLQAEFEKWAVGAALARKLLGSTTRGALAGAAVGGTSGALRAEEGERGSGALRGALGGAALGGIAGRAGRAAIDHTLLNPGATTGQALRGSAETMARGVANFGKRQVHGLTGAYGKNLHALGFDSSANAASKLQLAELRAADLVKRNPARAAKIREGLAERAKSIVESGHAGDERIRAGITSIPGVAKGLVQRPGATSRALWNAATGKGWQGKALALGIPAAAAAPDLARGDESATGGPTMRRKVLGLGTNVVGGIATAGLPFASQVVAGGAIDAIAAHRPRPNPQLAVSSPT